MSVIQYCVTPPDLSRDRWFLDDVPNWIRLSDSKKNQSDGVFNPFTVVKTCVYTPGEGVTVYPSMTALELHEKVRVRADGRSVMDAGDSWRVSGGRIMWREGAKIPEGVEW